MTGVPGDPLSLVGKTLAGHFLVQSLAAEGHTSFVYRGEHVGPKRPVALKCLKIAVELDAARADTFLKRLREESRVYSQASRNEPHFVRSIGTGMTATGNGTHVPYSVLEWLDGQSLAVDCKKRKATGVKPRTLAEVAALLAPTARALASVHAANLSHGDISSRNILLLKNPMSGFDTKLLDFGVAKVVRDVSRELSTSPNAPADDGPFWIPSPGYAAPEQLRRELGDVGPWSDVYSFAVVFLEAMCDRPLGTPMPQLSQIGLTLPESVERVLARALMESPQDRWPRGGEFWAALEDSLRVSAIQIPSRPPPPAPTGAQTLRLGSPVAPAAPVTAAGKQTVRLGGNAANAQRAAAKPALLPAAATRVPPAAGKPAVAVPAPTPVAVAGSTPVRGRAGAVTMPMTPPPVVETPSPASLEDQKPIAGTPVVFAKPLSVPPPAAASAAPKKSPSPPVVNPAPVAPVAASRVAAPSPAAPPVAAAPPPPPPPPAPPAPIPASPIASPISGPISAQPISVEPISDPVSSGPSSVPPPPPPPPPRGAILEVAPGPLPAPPPSSMTAGPMSENARSVSAAPPAARAQVVMESLPSVIVAEPEMQRNPPQNRPSGAETVRLHHPPASSPRMQVSTPSGPMSGMPGMPGPPMGLPPSSVMARPGVIVMPANMSHATPPSNHRVSYDDRRDRERKRLLYVMVITFAVVFVVGAGILALHFLRGRAATTMSAHSASN